MGTERAVRATGRRHLRASGQRFVVLAIGALVTYGATAWFFLLPPLPLPASPSGADAAGLSCPELASAPQNHAREVLLLTPLSAVPPYLIRRLLQQEDDFYYHSGVDWLRMARAFTKNLAARRYRYGASTITMQLARELYLGKERTLLRKIREIAYALQLERRLSKEEILGLYLNVVHWGPSIRGVGAAACYYFGVPPAGLDAEQAAQLVALLPSPDRLGPPLREAVQAARE